MISKFTAAILGGALLAASSVQAQQVAPTTATLPGVCAYSETGVINQSTAGQSFAKQFGALRQSVSTDINNQKAALDAQAKTLGATPAAQKNTPAFQAQVTALNGKYSALNTLVGQRDTQLTHTRDASLGKIATATVPLLNAAVAAHRCAIVVNSGAIVTYNPASMDLTNEVVQNLNKTLPSVSVALSPN